MKDFLPTKRQTIYLTKIMLEMIGLARIMAPTGTTGPTRIILGTIGYIKAISPT
jgi:hypothetical protein